MGADPSPAPAIRHAFECPGPFSEKRHEGDDDAWALLRAQTPHLAVARETLAGSRLEGFKGPHVLLHFWDTSPLSETPSRGEGGRGMRSGEGSLLVPAPLRGQHRKAPGSAGGY